MRLRIQEPLARQALESIREVVDYHQRWFVTFDTQARRRPPEAVAQYERICRLRDYLLSVSHETPIQLELDKLHANLLVSCAVFSMESIVDLMNEPGVNVEEWEHFSMTLRTLYSVALEFASDPVKIISRFDRRLALPEGVRRIVEAINAKTATGDVRPMPTIARPLLMPGPAKTNIVQDDVFLRDEWFSGDQVTRNPLPETSELAPIKAPGLEAGQCVDIDPSAEVEFGVPAEAAPATPQSPVELVCFPLNVRLIKETRLRELVDHAHRHLIAALDSRHFRVAGVMLCALLEGLVLDLAIRRRHELRLRGTPEDWDLDQILRTLLVAQGVDQDAGDRDDGIVDSIMACRHLLTPAKQLIHPRNVDRELMERMLDFVHGFASRSGFSVARSPM